MHLNDEQIQRFLHGELRRAKVPTSRRTSRRASCARGRVAEAEREESQVFDLLATLDHATPRRDIDAVMQTGAQNTRILGCALRISGRGVPR